MILKTIALWALLLVLASSTLDKFEVSWGLYRWVYNQRSAFEPLTQKSIQLSHPSVPYLSIQIKTEVSIKQDYNIYNSSQYSLQGNGSIKVFAERKSLQIQFFHIQHISLTIKCTAKQCREKADLLLRQLQSNQQIRQHCKSVEVNQYSCGLQNSTLTLSISLDQNKKISSESLQESKNFLQSAKNIIKFMKFHNISVQPSKLQMVKVALSSLVNSICLFQYDQIFYLGFCELNRNKKWEYNFKLAAFPIYLMADYFYGLAEAIYKDFFILTEIKLLYSVNEDTQVLPLIEHIQIFTRFGAILGLQNQAQLLNSFFVVPMLNQLGTLHQQLNYRQAKKLHPLLLKMLAQKWSSRNIKSTLKSIYEQSFTQDFKYHEYGQRLQQSIAKNAWLYKVIDTYTSILIKHHAYYMPVQQIKQLLQEHFTLLNIYKLYSNDQNNAKVGKYKDIVNVGDNLKLYSKYNGYDSILPYVYGLGKVYPETAIKELESNFGLKSSNQQQRQQYQRKYRFRGDIHAYFNLKIISGLLYRLEEDKVMIAGKKKQLIAHLNKIGANVATKIANNYKFEKKLYTSWTSDGKGRQSCDWLQIVTILFLKWI